MELKRYLITGAAGQLGMELTKRLGDEAMPKPREQFDIDDLKFVREWLPTLRPTMVIHCAAYNDVEQAETPAGSRKCWHTNTLATDNLLKACAEAGVPFLHISSNRVFNNYNKTPCQETDPVCPQGVFASSKAAAEHSILSLGQCLNNQYWERGFRYWILRTAHLYERPWRNSRNLPSQILNCEITRSPVKAHTQKYTSFTYVPHLADSVMHVVRNPGEVLNGVYHVANRNGGSYFDFADTLTRVTRKNINVVPQTDGPTTSAVLDTAKFIDSAGGPRLPCWKEALDEYAFELRK